MDAEDVVVNHHAQRKIIKHVGKVVPNIRAAVFATALRVEAIALRHAARFVIATYQVHARGIPQLEADEERDGFDGKQAAVDVVAQKEIVRVGAEAANLEYLEHVEELAVDVANHGDRRQDVHHVGLVHELLLELVAYRLDDGFGEEFLLV